MRFEKPEPHNGPQVGEGYEKRAYLLDSDPQMVTLAFKYPDYSAEQIRGLFYFQKLCHMLFPQHIVDIHQVGAVPSGEGTYSAYARTEKVDTTADPLHVALQREHIAAGGNSAEWTDEAHALQDTAEERDLANPAVQAFLDAAILAGIWHHADPWGPQDVIYDRAGGFTFVDTHVPWIEFRDKENDVVTAKLLLCYPDRVREAIARLEEPDRTKATTYFDRVLSLFASRPGTDDSDYDHPPKTAAELAADD